MTTPYNIALRKKLRRWSRYLILLVIGLGVLVWVGWQFNVEFLKRPIPHLASMNPTTSVLFTCLGISFLCFLPENPKRIRLTGYLFLFPIFIISLLRLLDAFFDTDIHVDEVIFSKKLDDDITRNFSKRMAPNTAVCFLLASVALSVLNIDRGRKITPAQFISLLLALFALLSILGCVYGVQPFYLVLAYIPMAIHTAIGFLFVSLALLFSSPDKGIMMGLTSAYTGSQMARRLLPAAIFVPMLLGYLRLWGHWAGIFSVEFGAAILVLSIIVIFVLLIWFTTVALNHKDALRIEAEKDLKTSLKRLTESEEKFQKAFQASAAGISLTRLSDSTYYEVNYAFTKMTGYSKEELTGHTSLELGIVSDIRKRDEVLRQIREKGTIDRFEMTVKHKSGSLVEVLSSVDTILLNDEKYAINFIIDITDRKLAEKQLEALNKELEAFSYSISHDLRAPLRAVDGYAKMIEEDYHKLLDEEGIKFLDAIQYNAKKMSYLIDDLLAFSRLGRKAVIKSELDMNELVENVLKDIDRSVNQKTEIKVSSLNPAYGDYGLIKQIFVNLVSNAIKYSSKKSNPLIEISSEQKGNEVLYTVKDNGVGFDMEYADKLFGVFQRLHSDREFEGTGVGLAIVQRIVHKHGGEVWAEAEPDKGATFKFSLPIA
jgi:PAS domain S-box-containing protein